MTEEFRFKRFSIRQHVAAGMKVGTDGVLLGAWCRVERWQRLFLDAGTGTGVIALMLAQRSAGNPAARIDALDIDEACCEQTFENTFGSPWGSRISVVNSSLQAWAIRRAYPRRLAGNRTGSLASWASRPELYDHIVSNPPYFTSSLLPPSAGRTTARHTLALPHADLAESVAALLSPQGIFSVVLPTDASDSFIDHAGANGLVLARMCEVAPKGGAPPKRTLMEFAHKEAATGDVRRTTLTIAHTSGEDFTEEYRELTRDFYLKF